MILLDFLCDECNTKFEELVDNRDIRFQPCPECGTPSEKVMSAVSLGKYSMATPEQRSEMLRKRSEEHTKKEILSKEYDKFGMKDPNSSPWNVRATKPKSAKKNKKTTKSR